MATIAEQLAEAKDAYHALMTGRSVRVYVDQNGERMEYTPATKSSLKAYIDDLQSQVDNPAAIINVGPMRLMF